VKDRLEVLKQAADQFDDGSFVEAEILQRMDDLKLAAEVCWYCAEVLDELEESERVSCKCCCIVVWRECFEGDDGIKDSVNVKDSVLFSPFLTGEAGRQVVSGYVNRDTIACVECIGNKQHIGFTPRKESKAKGGTKNQGTEGAPGASRNVNSVSSRKGSDVSQWADWAEHCKVILKTLADVGGKPNDLVKSLLWKMIGEAPPAVIALAKKHVSWSPEKGVWGVKGEWAAFISNVTDLMTKWSAGAPKDVSVDDGSGEMLLLERSKLSHDQALDGSSRRSKALHECLVMAPSIIQNLFTTRLSWDSVKGMFAVQSAAIKAEVLHTLDAMSGKPAMPRAPMIKMERLVPGSEQVTEGLVSLREEGPEEEHLLRGGSRFEGQSRLAATSAGSSLRQLDIRQGMGAAGARGSGNSGEGRGFA